MPQLSPHDQPLDAARLAEIAAGPATTLLCARQREGGAIVGTVTLVAFRIPSGKRARIESLVVLDRARGQGVGQALCLAAIERARAAGADSVDLTSAPERQAANRLYRRLGFAPRATNVYRLQLG
jgi:ribosomal protein S18 acetylase RimI-like enzyme